MTADPTSIRKRRGLRLTSVALGLLTLLASLPPSATGGRITLDLDSSWRMEAGILRLDCRVTNRGDEPAQVVHMDATLGETVRSSATLEVLEVNASTTLSAIFTPPPESPGRHTAILRLRYEDTRGFPFNALDVIPVHTAFPEPQRWSDGRLGKLSLRDRGSMTLELRTTDDRPLAGHFRLFLPDELTSTPLSREIALTPGVNWQTTLPVINRWAQPGSRYRVYGVFDYLRDGMHRSDVLSTEITILPDRALSPVMRRLGFAIAGVFLLAFAGLQIRRNNHAARSND